MRFCLFSKFTQFEFQKIDQFWSERFNKDNILFAYQ